MGLSTMKTVLAQWAWHNDEALCPRVSNIRNWLLMERWEVVVSEVTTGKPPCLCPGEADLPALQLLKKASTGMFHGGAKDTAFHFHFKWLQI